MSNLPAISAEVIIKLDTTIKSVISAADMSPLEKTFLIATATADLKQVLNGECMDKIMHLQGSRLGFRTDKDDSGGYSKEVVKSCVIDALLYGVDLIGNQFNIMSGGCYITKEGFGHLLNKFPDLESDIIPSFPVINQKKTSAAVTMTISWNGNSVEKTFTIPMDKFLSIDAIIGKATRKARAWLFGKLTGIEVGEGDVTEINGKESSQKFIDGFTYIDLMELYESKKPMLSDDELRDFDRILNGREENSYKKIHSILIAK